MNSINVMLIYDMRLMVILKQNIIQLGNISKWYRILVI